MMKEVELQILVNEKLCDLADAILYYYNPCQLNKEKHNCKDKNLEIIPCCTYHHYTGGKECIFLKKDGCSYRNIKCKTWLCEEALKDIDPKCLETLKLLVRISKIFNLDRYPSLGIDYGK